MADLPTLPGTAVAFTEYLPSASRSPDGEIAILGGGILRAIRGGTAAEMKLPSLQTHYGYLAEGTLEITCMDCTITVPEGFYFSLPCAAHVRMRSAATGIIISRPHYRGFLLMGKLEYEGRLKYINGCNDSLLIPPIKLGDPCVNLLYFPPGTNQTMHTHPSDRIGLILSGQGQCITEDDRGSVVIPLRAGMLFCIHTGGRHKFLTHQGSMRVLAYHPDSDFGPTDEDHPMINRTMIGGVSANKLPEIHTQ